MHSADRDEPLSGHTWRSLTHVRKTYYKYLGYKNKKTSTNTTKNKKKVLKYRILSIYRIGTKYTQCWFWYLSSFVVSSQSRPTSSKLPRHQNHPRQWKMHHESHPRDIRMYFSRSLFKGTISGHLYKVMSRSPSYTKTLPKVVIVVSLKNQGYFSLLEVTKWGCILLEHHWLLFFSRTTSCSAERTCNK